MMLNIFDISGDCVPLYEFICQDCDQDFELICKYHDLEAVRCTHCHSAVVERQVSMGSFQLKGSGWAHDRYGLSAATADSISPEKSSSDATS